MLQNMPARNQVRTNPRMTLRKEFLIKLHAARTCWLGLVYFITLVESKSFIFAQLTNQGKKITFSTPTVQNLWKTPENYPLAQTHKGFGGSRLESTQFENPLIFKVLLNTFHSGGQVHLKVFLRINFFQISLAEDHWPHA